jgi:hypothetical protein
MSAKAAQSSPSLAKLADGGMSAPMATTEEGASVEAERRRQIRAILEQGDRDIAADNGREWDEVKQRMRDRIAARMR